MKKFHLQTVAKPLSLSLSLFSVLANPFLTSRRAAFRRSHRLAPCNAVTQHVYRVYHVCTSFRRTRTNWPRGDISRAIHHAPICNVRMCVRIDYLIGRIFLVLWMIGGDFQSSRVRVVHWPAHGFDLFLYWISVTECRCRWVKVTFPSLFFSFLFFLFLYSFSLDRRIVIEIRKRIIDKVETCENRGGCSPRVQVGDASEREQ